jgi:hypothetical protein
MGNAENASLEILRICDENETYYLTSLLRLRSVYCSREGAERLRNSAGYF